MTNQAHDLKMLDQAPLKVLLTNVDYDTYNATLAHDPDNRLTSANYMAMLRTVDNNNGASREIAVLLDRPVTIELNDEGEITQIFDFGGDFDEIDIMGITGIDDETMNLNHFDSYEHKDLLKGLVDRLDDAILEARNKFNYQAMLTNFDKVMCT